MKTIVEARENVANIWGKQKQKEADYRPLLYLVRAECEEGTLVLNTVTGQMVLLTAEELTALDALPGPLPQILQPLMEAHFVVPVDYDEKKSVQQLRALMQRRYHINVVNTYVILPTTACNARCFYCYEANYPQHNMTEETACQVVEYIAAHCGPDKIVSLNWFGGEPMVGRARIDQICTGLEERGISFTSDMISNTYLYTKALALHAVDVWHLESIQVTLDGTEEVYNKAKAYVNATGSPYHRVLENIGYLLDAGVEVRIRMNMDRYNAENLKLLIQELARFFPGRRNLSAYCAILFENMGFDPVAHTEDELERLENAFNEIETLLRAAGLSQPVRVLPSLALKHCMADDPDYLLINPLGELSKCENLPLAHLVGNLSQGITNPDQVKEWKRQMEYPLCSGCGLYPACVSLTHCIQDRECKEINKRRKTAYTREAMLQRYLHPEEPEQNAQGSCS